MRKAFISFIFATLAVTTAYAADHKEVRGFSIVGETSDILGTAGVGVGGRYWDEYIGGAFGFTVEKSDIQADGGGSIFDATVFGFSGGLLLGFPKDNFKPYFSFGIAYSKADDDASGIELDYFQITPAFGVDFAAAENLIIGFDILSFPYIITGNIGASGSGSADFDGFVISLLNTFRVGYQF